MSQSCGSAAKILLARGWTEQNYSILNWILHLINVRLGMDMARLQLCSILGGDVRYMDYNWV